MVIEITRYFDGSRRFYNFKGPWDAVKEADLNIIAELWKDSKHESLDNIYLKGYKRNVSRSKYCNKKKLFINCIAM